MLEDNESGKHSKELTDWLRKAPKMRFERYLQAEWTYSAKDKDHKWIEIPVVFGATMLMLREKHDHELSRFKSFIESDPPPKPVTDNYADKILLRCQTPEDVYAMLGHLKPVNIFFLILELLRRLPSRLFPLSDKTARVSTKTSLLEPVHPYDFVICDRLYTAITQYYSVQGDDEGVTYSKKAKPTDKVVHPIVEETYLTPGLSRKRMIKVVNKFNKCIYHDLHAMDCADQRNLARFIIRNTIFLVRKYNMTFLRKLRAERAENWPTAMITTRPHVNEYSYNKIADLLGPVLFGCPFSSETCPGFEKATMLNILASGLDRMWLSGQKLGDIVVELEPTFCHANCICGRGQAMANPADAA